MTTVLLIVGVKILVVCLHWPALLSRIGAGVASIARFVGAALVRRRDEDALEIPEARVVQRPR